MEFARRLTDPSADTAILIITKHRGIGKPDAAGVVTQFGVRSFTSFRMTTPTKCRSEREESYLPRFLLKTRTSPAKMSHYRVSAVAPDELRVRKNRADWRSGQRKL
jgi:hypothetical protein